MPKYKKARGKRARRVRALVRHAARIEQLKGMRYEWGLDKLAKAETNYRNTQAKL